MKQLLFVLGAMLCLWSSRAAAEATSQFPALRTPPHRADAIAATAASGAGGGGTSSNWAGYAIDQRTTSVSGSWSVPAVSYASYPDSNKKEYSSTWIGIGGNAAGDGTLIQLGTAQEVEQNGTTKYYAWYDLVNGLTVPATRIPISISPGDAVRTELKCIATCNPNISQKWAMSVVDLTNHQSWTGQVDYVSSLSSVEWIMEASTLPEDGRISDLPVFKSVKFEQIYANNAQPSLSLASNGISLIGRQGSPAATPTVPAADGFLVNQTYVPPPVPLPGHPAWLSCKSNDVDYGLLTSSPLHISGTFSAYDPPKRYGFFLSHYARLDAYALGAPPRSFTLSVVDDLTGRTWSLPPFPQETFLDPGYYCLEIRASGGNQNVSFAAQLSAMRAGFNPIQEKYSAFPLGRLDLGPLSSNVYFGKSRYVNDGDLNVPYSLRAAYLYVMRDWLDPSLSVQWFRFTTTQPCKINIGIGNMYLDAHVSLEDDAGNILGASAANGISLTTLLPPQFLNTVIPPGTFYVKIAFGGVGGPGTPFSFQLVGCD